MVRLHPDGVETNEPCIAIDPNNPSIQLLGSNVDFVFSSSDGGYSWAPKTVESKYGFYGDPVTFISKEGVQYICHLARNKDKPWPEHFDRIVLERSMDGGNSFSSSFVGHREGKVQDKPWLYLDEREKSRYRGRLYLSWTEFDSYGSTNPDDSSRIRIAWSDDGGATFGETVVISDSAGDAADNDNTLEGATIAAGKRGELFAVWAGAGKIWFDQSTDGGKTWGIDRVIAEQKGGWHQEIPGLMRSNSMPFVTADKKGHLYVVFGDNRNGDADVFYIYSSDAGETWSAPIRINDDELKNGRDQYMPHLVCDRKQGRVYAVFYDRRNSELNRYTDVYGARLKRNKVYPNLRITNESFCVAGKKTFFGDYISVAAERGVVRAAYTAYDQEKMFATVEVALLSSGSFKKPENDVPVFIRFIQLADTDQIYIHFRVPDAKSCTIELTRGSQLYYKQLYNPLEKAENEVMLPVSKFKEGVYRLSLSFKGRKLETDVFLERR